MVEEVPVTQARAEFAELVNRVGYTGARIVLSKHGKPLAALVPPADLERLERLDAGEAGVPVLPEQNQRGLQVIETGSAAPYRIAAVGEDPGSGTGTSPPAPGAS